MSRVKHLTMLIIKLAYLVLVFAVTMVMMSMQTATSDEIPLARGANESSIQISTSNGATATWEIVDGELVFDIQQSGESYDDIVAFLFFENVSYDTTFMRSLLGENAGEHE